MTPSKENIRRREKIAVKIEKTALKTGNTVPYMFAALVGEKRWFDLDGNYQSHFSFQKTPFSRPPNRVIACISSKGNKTFNLKVKQIV